MVIMETGHRRIQVRPNNKRRAGGLVLQPAGKPDREFQAKGAARCLRSDSRAAMSVIGGVMKQTIFGLLLITAAPAAANTVYIQCRLAGG